MSLDIEISKDGYKILKIDVSGKKQYLGSKYNQKREIEKFVNGLGELTEKDNFIILGLSFAEHIKELLKVIYKSSNILIIELNNEIKKYCINDINIDKILKDSRVTLAKDSKDIKDFFEKNINVANINQLKVTSYCNYEKLYNKDLQDSYKIIKKETMRIVLDRNTGIKTSEISFDNFLNNLKYIAKSTVVNELKGRYKNKGAVIVSAGPSLSKNIDNLKNVNNALILSGGRTIRPLMEKDIMPSLVGIADPGEVSYKIVEGYIDRINCPLIFNDQINSKIVEHHSENNFFTSLNNFLNDVWKLKVKSLYAGGSVAHMLTTLALYMGCNPIIFIGQDFAYTGERGHDELAENKWKEFTFDDYKRNDDIYVEDIYGNPVRTSLTLNDYRLSMEDIIEKHPDVNFINATEGGANINGAQNITLEDALKSLEDESIEKVGKYLENEDKTNEIIQELKCTLNNFDKYVRLCEKGLLSLKDYKKAYYSKNISLVRKCEETLQDIDYKIRKDLDSLDIIETELSRMIYTLENNTEFLIALSDNDEIKFDKNVNKSETLYLGIKDVICKCNKKIEKIIIELGEK